MYYQPSTGATFSLHSEVRHAMPWVLFGDSITDADLALQGIFPVALDKPELEPGQVAVPLAIEFVDDQWTQLWTVREATSEELDAMKPPVPQQITSGQGREALYNAGLFANVQPAIDAIDDVDMKWRVQNAWDYRPTWERQSPFVAMMAGILGLDGAALDQLFITAAAL